MVDNPTDVQQAAEAFDYVKTGGLVLGVYASVLSTINFLSDRVRRLTLHVENKKSDVSSTNMLRIFAVCKSGTILVPEIEVVANTVEGKKVELGTISIGEALKKGDLKVFDYPVDALASYKEIWVEVSGYKMSSSSNVLKVNRT